MTHSVKHQFVSVIPDGSDDTLIRPSNWNSDHYISIDLTSSDITTSVTGTSGQNTITVGSASGLYPGMSVTGTGIAAGAKIVSIVSTTVTLTDNNSGTVSGTGTFTALYGPLPIAKGGTGASTQNGAVLNILNGLSAGSSGQVLTTNGLNTYFWSTPGSGGASGNTVATTRTTETATAGQTLFTTPTYVIGAAQLNVYINGIRQFSNAYTETSTTSITFSTGLTVGDEVMFEVNSVINTPLLASNVGITTISGMVSTNTQDALAELYARSTGAGSTVSSQRAFYTATAGQTLFTGVPTYTIGTGQLRVYLNGVRLYNADYTETSITSVTLAVACSLGDSVMVEVDAYSISTTTGSGNIVLANGPTVQSLVVSSGGITVTGDSSITSTGALKIPAGTTAEQPAGAAGKIRFNTTVGKYEGHNGASWGQLGGGATGGGSDTVFMLNGQTVTTDYTIPTGFNAVSAGPVDIANGATVTIGDTEYWTIV